MQRLLIQTQLSNYTTKGLWVLECDSGWQMCIGRAREMLKLNPELDITITGPRTGTQYGKRQLITDPWDVNPDLWEKYGEGDGGENRLHYFEHKIIANALVTRYDFDWTELACGLDLGMQKLGRVPRWDAVYVNDPMQLRNFKAMFHVVGGYQPKFYVHSHFVDCPSCPKFPTEASLWLGQCEATLRADWNFWQCTSALAEFECEARKLYRDEIVDTIMSKSSPWDDGYSIDEITRLPDMENVRFDVNQFLRWKHEGKVIIFVPNRIGGQGRSSDYTNCGKFMFEALPELRKLRQDFVIIAGNPNQKFLNHELEKMCGEHGYASLVPDAFNRDEYKVVARNADIAVGLYDQDTFGGTASRECIELGCMPLWVNKFEYSSITSEARCTDFLVRPGFSNLVQTTSAWIDLVKGNPAYVGSAIRRLQEVVRRRCSYEATTPEAMKKMGLL